MVQIKTFMDCYRSGCNLQGILKFEIDYDYDLGGLHYPCPQRLLKKREKRDILPNYKRGLFRGSQPMSARLQVRM